MEGNLDPFALLGRGSNAHNQPKENEFSRTSVRVDDGDCDADAIAWNQMGCDPENKKAVIHEEISRITKLPANSSYATHRLRVLDKILSLLSLERTTSQDEELELLFAGLSM